MAATVVADWAASAVVGVVAVSCDAICSCALFRSFVRIRIWSCIDKMICSILESGCSPRILSIRRSAATTASEFLDFCRQGAIDSTEKSVNGMALCCFFIGGGAGI